MRAITEAVARLAEDPYPPESFPWGNYRRLRVGPYRVMYAIEEKFISIEHIDRVADD